MPPFEIEEEGRPPARIKVIGVGGGGCNAVDGMMASGLENVEFYAVNTDIQALGRTRCPNRVQIGPDVTGGLGCGGDPLTGEKAASTSKEQIRGILEGADMVFLTAGLGGGTGTGATPVIAQMAKEAGILTVAIVTKPFHFEGPQRMQKALQGVEKLREYVDTLIIVSNDRLLEVVGNKATLLEAFALANNVLAQGVQSISDLISVPGLINLDFADVRAIMGERGGAVMGVGVGKGENRAEEAVKKACSSPLLDKIEIDGATGVLICITGPPDLKLSEITTATSMVYEAADKNANIIFGAGINEDLTDEIRVTIIATGFADEVGRKKRRQEDKERLTSPTSSVSLRAKLESMLSTKGERESRAESAPSAEAAPEVSPDDTGEEQMPPPPKFPEAAGGEAVGEDIGRAAPDPTVAVADEAGGVEGPVFDDESGPEIEGPRGRVFDDSETLDDEIDFSKIPPGSRDEIAGEEPSAQEPETPSGEDDLETPAYFRRRRDLFE